MRYDRSAGGSLDDFCITADLFADGDIREFIKKRIENAFPGECAEHVLRTVLKENIAEYVMAYAGISSGRALTELDDRDIEALGAAVHSLRFTPSSIRGWKDAQATSGGVSLDEICPETCESMLVPGLYITGELADRDYPCGGFNLSNAWYSGIKAAEAIAKRSK
jgi:predicted flavoprotein YhiN